MARFACLVVPRFAIASLRRSEPELRGCPVVVCDPGGVARRDAAARPHARILDVSAEAARRGVTPGLTVVQALARSSDLTVRPLDREALAAGRSALVDVASSVSSRIEGEGSDDDVRGTVYLDVTGSERLFETPGGLMAALVQRAERIGFEAGVAIADRKATARIAAGIAARRGEAILVAEGGDSAWLAPRPLVALGPVADRVCGELGGNGRRAPRRTWPEVAEELARLGIARLADLAALPIAEVVSRFGAPGARLWRIAAGADDSPLAAVPPALELVEGTSLEYGLASLESLLFVVRGLVDRLVARLRLRGLACRGLVLSFALEDGARVEREVGVLAPTCDVKSLVLLARSAIEAAPPHAAIEAVRATAIPDRARPDQLDLFRAAGPPPARLATALARLAALCGQERIGRPVAPAGHRPEAFGLSPFALAADGDRSNAGRSEAAAPQHGDVRTAAGLALRALRPPRPAEVFLESGRIAYVRAPGLGGRALGAAGPWRLDAEWWSETACRRDYWEVQLSDGGVYRLFHDTRRWWVDGVYD
ncbi:MAG TPA: DNA polymerase Y family protein [Candidatus Binatia bacterium]|nr:DNA polymerase Y family protein [Candidatus Binatia bacterium]